VRRRAASAMLTRALLACALNYGGAAAEQGPEPEKSSSKEVPTNVKIAELKNLRPDPRAESLLAEMLSDLRRKMDSAVDFQRPSKRKAAAEAAIADLVSFASSYPTSREALLAKYMVGHILFGGVFGHNTAESMECFQDIVDHYPKTREAVLAKLKLLSLKLRQADRQWRDEETGMNLDRVRECQAALMEAYTSSLGVAKEIDQDQSALGRQLKGFLLGNGKTPFAASIRYAIASLTSKMGKRQEARKLYEGLVREFPGTDLAQCAQRALAGMDIIEELEKKGELPKEPF